MAKKKSSSAEAVKARTQKATSKRTSKGYDADKYAGAIPGLAERMKEYMEHMRDDRRVDLPRK